MITPIVVASRHGKQFIAGWAMLLVVSAVLGQRGLKIEFTRQYPPVVMTVPEFCGMLLTCLGVVLLRPRMWVLDRLGVPSRRWIPAVGSFAAAVLAAQSLILVAGVTGMPAVETHRAAANVFVLTALAWTIAPFLGAFMAGGVVLVVYLTALCALQMEPRLQALSPISAVVVSDGRWVLALAGVGLAGSIAWRTLGRTRLTWGRDRDLS